MVLKETVGVKEEEVNYNIATHYKEEFELRNGFICSLYKISLISIPAQFEDMFLLTVELSLQDIFI